MPKQPALVGQTHGQSQRESKEEELRTSASFCFHGRRLVTSNIKQFLTVQSQDIAHFLRLTNWTGLDTCNFHQRQRHILPQTMDIIGRETTREFDSSVSCLVDQAQEGISEEK